ncbi:MAG: hypothetical protein ACI9KM_000318, partial [Rubritalea sp.]
MAGIAFACAVAASQTNKNTKKLYLIFNYLPLNSVSDQT